MSDARDNFMATGFTVKLLKLFHLPLLKLSNNLAKLCFCAYYLVTICFTHYGVSGLLY